MQTSTEYLVILPSGAQRWITYSPSMLDASDEDDRPVAAAIRAAGLPTSTRGAIEYGRQVRR